VLACSRHSPLNNGAPNVVLPRIRQSDLTCLASTMLPLVSYMGQHPLHHINRQWSLILSCRSAFYPSALPRTRPLGHSLPNSLSTLRILSAGRFPEHENCVRKRHLLARNDFISASASSELGRSRYRHVKSTATCDRLCMHTCPVYYGVEMTCITGTLSRFTQ
jgi:hypothetical protein